MAEDRPAAVVPLSPREARGRVAAIFIETPANPTLKLADIAAIAKITRRAGVLLAVDNTFLTSLLQPIFELGADISVLSTTKYIEGHNARDRRAAVRYRPRPGDRR